MWWKWTILFTMQKDINENTHGPVTSRSSTFKLKRKLTNDLKAAKIVFVLCFFILLFSRVSYLKA